MRSRRPLPILRTAAVAAAAIPAVPTAYLAALTAIGSARPRADDGRLDEPPTTTFAILVPAHDEAVGIHETLDSFTALRYPRAQFVVHVVADNCTDDTAAVVREHGWTAHERTAPHDPGKGPALNWLMDRLAEAGANPDAVVIVDADTTLDPDFLNAIDRALAEGAVAAQGHYSVREPEASPAASFRYAAMACRHHLRPLARNRIGASCGLYGNGMAFRWELARRHRWTGHLVEDAELQMTLLQAGELVTYVPGARLWAEMPDDLESATSQNQRWERGRIELARRHVPALLARAVRDRRHRIARVDAALDHLVPPLSVLAVAHGALVATGAALRLSGRRTGSPIALLHLTALAVLALHTVVGLRSVGAPARHVRALAGAPEIMAWKVRLWCASLVRDDIGWTRTRRRGEGAPVTSEATR